MHPIYHYSCISWPRYSKNPKLGVSFSFVFIGIFSDNFLFFLGLPIIKLLCKMNLDFYLSLAFEFRFRTNSGLSLLSSFEQHVPEFNKEFMLPEGVGGAGVGACVVCTPPPPPVFSPIKTKTFTMNYIYTDTALVP